MKKNNKGFSLIEIVVVLAIMGVIASFLTPMLFNYMSDSKTRRAQNDVAAIASAIGNFNSDTGVYPVYSGSKLAKANATIKVLVSDGLTTTLGANAGAWNPGNTTVGASAWTEDNEGSALRVHLENGTLKGGTSYNSSDCLQRPNSWRGPYMTDFKADPWGNRYYVSTEGLWPGSTKAAFVLSAGPNAEIETNLSQLVGTGSAGSTSLVIGGDDIAFRIK